MTEKFWYGEQDDTTKEIRWRANDLSTIGGGLSDGDYGDIVVSSGGTAINLDTTGTAGAYGSATQVPVFTTDTKGRVTAVTNTTITGLLPSGTTNQTLAHNGTSFVATGNLTTNVSTGEVSVTNGDLRINGQKELKFYDNDTSNYAGIKAPLSIGTDYTLILPADDGAAGQVLSTDGSGVLSWATNGSSATNMRIYKLPFNKATSPNFTTADIPDGFFITNIVVDVQVALTGPNSLIKIDGATDLNLLTENASGSFASAVGIYRIAIWNKTVATANVGKLHFSVPSVGTGSGVIYLEGGIPNV